MAMMRYLEWAAESDLRFFVCVVIPICVVIGGFMIALFIRLGWL